MKYYGVWILPATINSVNASTRQRTEMEIDGYWMNDRNRIVFNTTSKGLAQAQSDAILEPSLMREFDE